ncbi:MAG: metallophosphoesterase [Candidatus Krumholzibacteriota bacterium]|nr:metallophosphoesterase [Candidatus Krumholzibacteriota bacterium]
MTDCLFVSDLHGRMDRYRKLFAVVAGERPRALFVGGDILPHVPGKPRDFLGEYLLPELARLRADLGEEAPRVFLVLGNDDGRADEERLLEAEAAGILSYAHGRAAAFGTWSVYGYAFTPPSPFLLKDWERYDVSRYVDPGCISPEEGSYSVPVAPEKARYATISEDLGRLAGSADLSRAVFLFHAPPYRTALDRAALDGRMIDHVPVDVHVGSIAIRRFIESRQPLLTLHGHVHESARLTGSWRETIGRTLSLSAAHDGPELAIVRFSLDDPGGATRELH